MILTNKVPGHLLVLLYAADIRELQQRVNVVGVQLQQSLQGKKRDGQKNVRIEKMISVE